MGRRFRYEWLAAATLAVSALGTMGCDGDDDAIVIDAGIEDSGPTADVTQNDVVQPDAPATDSPTGGPVASITAAPVDLGAGDCGGAAVTKTVTINNTGGKPLTISATTSGVPFTVTPATSTIAPGAAGTFTVSVAVPAASVAGTKLSGTITVTTNDPAKPSITVPVSITPEGATFAFATGTPTSADFGQAKLNQADTPINLTLKNTGNKAATVTFGAPSSAQFSLSSTPASPALLAPNATAALVTGFTPTTLSPSTATSNMTIAGAVCGVSVNKISFSGQGTAGAVTGWPSNELDFGFTPCGGAAPTAKTFTLTNNGTAEVTITGVTVGTKGYGTDLTVGTKIAAGAAKIVTVTAPAVPFPSPVPGDFNDTLKITTDIPGDAPHSIPLVEAAFGAILAFDTSASTSFGAFGNVPVGTSASEQFLVTNTGNAPATVTTVSAAPFGVSEASFTIGASSGVPTTHGLAATFTPANTQPQVGSVGVTATGLCQALPKALPLTGTGQNGGISLSTNSLQFSADCNKTAPPQSFTIKNSGNVPMTWTAKLVRAAQSPYALDVTTATLAAGAETIVTVTPAQIPQTPADISPSAFADDVLITTDIVNDTNHTVSLSETALGAVLTFEPSNQLDFGDVPVNTPSASQDLTVKNSGNIGTVTTVSFATTNGAFAIATPGGPAAPGGVFTSGVTFNPTNTAVQNANLSVAVGAGEALCAPLPTPRAATGTGTNAQVVYNSAPIDFDNVNCGGVAGPKTVTFSNLGNQDYNVTAATLRTGTYFTVTMSDPSGLVPKNNGGSLVITLTPKPIPQTVPSVPDTTTYSDLLTVTTNAAGDTPHPIDVLMGAQGVILKPIAAKTWDFGTVSFGSTGFYNVPLRNVGNVATTVTMSGLSFPVFGFQAPTIAPNKSTTITGTFSPDSTTQSYGDGGTLVFPAGTVFCQPQPNYDITLIGKGGDGALLTITGSLAFPGVDCNGAPNTAQNVTVRNNSNAPISYTTAFDYATYYGISSGGSGTIPANGGAAVIAVQPTAIVQGPNTYSGSAPYADRLVINIGGTGYAVPISQTARGSELDYYISGSAASYEDGTPWWTGELYVYNNGNYPATIGLSIPDSRWNVVTPSAVAGANSYSSQLYNYSTTTGPWYYCGNYYSGNNPYQTSQAPATMTVTGTVCRNSLPTTPQTQYGYAWYRTSTTCP